MDLLETIPVVKNIFHITLVNNTGVAFGMFGSFSAFFTIVGIVAVVGFGLFFAVKYKTMTFIEKTAILFIIGGTLGNLADRIMYGYVIDFLDFIVWPVFNVADSFITIGVVAIVISVLADKKTHGGDNAGKRQNA